VSRDLKAFLKIKTMLQLAQFGYNDWNFLYWRQSWLDLNRIASSLVPCLCRSWNFPLLWDLLNLLQRRSRP
jgi:hypothetical protein